MFAPRRSRHGGRDGYAMLLLMQLAAQIYQLENKPPVTVGAIALMVALHFGYLPSMVPYSMESVCLVPSEVIRGGFITVPALRRLVGSSFLHLSDYHLVYNMGSLLWKGVQLERFHGSGGFAVLLTLMTLLSGLCTVGIAIVAAMMGYDSWLGECSVGFSGVLFGLKTVLQYDSDGSSYIYGFTVPTRYAAWAELLIISLTMPYTSFVGHLGGILAGLVYIGLERRGALRRLMRALQNVVAMLGTPLAPPAEAGWAANGHYYAPEQPRAPTGGRPAGQRFYGGGVPLGSSSSSARPSSSSSSSSSSGADGLRYRGSGTGSGMPGSGLYAANRGSSASAEGASRYQAARESDEELARRLQREEDERAARVRQGYGR